MRSPDRLPYTCARARVRARIVRATRSSRDIRDRSMKLDGSGTKHPIVTPDRRVCERKNRFRICIDYLFAVVARIRQKMKRR